MVAKTFGFDLKYDIWQRTNTAKEEESLFVYLGQSGSMSVGDDEIYSREL